MKAGIAINKYMAIPVYCIIEVNQCPAARIGGGTNHQNSKNIEKWRRHENSHPGNEEYHQGISWGQGIK
jgi:hypothetical protein